MSATDDIEKAMVKLFEAWEDIRVNAQLSDVEQVRMLVALASYEMSKSSMGNKAFKMSTPIGVWEFTPND